MRITEYRIMLPYSIEEVESMSSYLMSQIKERAKQGVESERDYYGEAIWRQWFKVKKDSKNYNARFTYYQDNNWIMPKWRQSMFTDDNNVLDVRYWLVYGSITKSLITMSVVDKFYCETYCKVRDYARTGHDNNIFRLYEEQLAQRKIIAVSVRKAGDLISCGTIEDEDVPLNEVHDDWVQQSLRVGSPVTCVYYLTCVDFPYKMQAYMEKYMATKLRENILMYHLKNLANLGARMKQGNVKAEIAANKKRCDEKMDELEKESASYDQFMAYGLDTIKMEEWLKNYRIAIRELEVKATVTQRRCSLESILVGTIVIGCIYGLLGSMGMILTIAASVNETIITPYEVLASVVFVIMAVLAICGVMEKRVIYLQWLLVSMAILMAFLVVSMFVTLLLALQSENMFRKDSKEGLSPGLILLTADGVLLIMALMNAWFMNTINNCLKFLAKLEHPRPAVVFQV
ncbi:hypothetical protein QR680_016247 [Steinernema hermaphroditum]|uniref:Phosphatidylinositol transfer protein N-terminal domain-containing protein n=1 Tax=Steinernema hermaphroditum TaxID=289476 RepID=A0AA39HD29_9BILA|nr:hypothetical protein QR680_016247 [Steinernema hermaphroditum]